VRPVTAAKGKWREVADGGEVTLHHSQVMHRTSFSRFYFQSPISMQVGQMSATLVKPKKCDLFSALLGGT